MGGDAFNPHIAALAMPQSGVLSEGGRALMGMSAFLRDERMSRAQERALEQNTKLAEQQYNFNTAFNPLKLTGAELQNRQSAFALESAKANEEHKAALRPFELERARLSNEGERLNNALKAFNRDEGYANTNIEARLGEMSFAQEPKLWSEELIKKIEDDPTLTPSKKFYRIKMINRARARYAAGRRGGNDEALNIELDGIFEGIKNNPYVAAHFSALRPDGSIDEEKFYSTFSANFRGNKRGTLGIINKLKADKSKIDKENADAFRGLDAMESSLDGASDYGNKQVDAYMGIFDVIGNWIKRLKNEDEGSLDAQRLENELKNTYIKNSMVGRSLMELNQRRSEADGKTEAMVWTGQEKSKLQKLTNLALNAQIAKLKTLEQKADNEHIRQVVQKQIARAEALRGKLLTFYEDPNTQTQPVWQDLPVQNPAGQNQIPQNPAPMQNLYQGARAFTPASLSPEREKQLDSFWN